MTATANPHIGSGLDELLEADGVLAEAQAVAVKRVGAWQTRQSATGQAGSMSVRAKSRPWNSKGSRDTAANA